MKITRESLEKSLELCEKATHGAHEWDTEEPASEVWKSNKVHNAAFVRHNNPEFIKALVQAHIEAVEIIRSAYIKLECHFAGCEHKTRSVNSGPCSVHGPMFRFLSKHGGVK